MKTYYYYVKAPEYTKPFDTQLPAIFQTPKESVKVRGLIKERDELDSKLKKKYFFRSKLEAEIASINKEITPCGDYPGKEIGKIFRKYGARLDTEYGVDEIKVEAQNRKEADDKIFTMFNDFKSLIKIKQKRDIKFKMADSGLGMLTLDTGKTAKCGLVEVYN